MQPNADWYPAPEDPSKLQYWDGEKWTNAFRPSAGGLGPQENNRHPSSSSNSLIARYESFSLIHKTALIVGLCLALLIGLVLANSINSARTRNVDEPILSNTSETKATEVRVPKVVNEDASFVVEDLERMGFQQISFRMKYRKDGEVPQPISSYGGFKACRTIPSTGKRIMTDQKIVVIVVPQVRNCDSAREKSRIAKEKKRNAKLAREQRKRDAAQALKEKERAEAEEQRRKARVARERAAAEQRERAAEHRRRYCDDDWCIVPDSLSLKSDFSGDYGGVMRVRYIGSGSASGSFTITLTRTDNERVVATLSGVANNVDRGEIHTVSLLSTDPVQKNVDAVYNFQVDASF